MKLVGNRSLVEAGFREPNSSLGKSTWQLPIQEVELTRGRLGALCILTLGAWKSESTATPHREREIPFMAEVQNKPSLIAFSPNNWLDPAWDNRQQVLSRLAARGWPVVYSTGALSLWDRHRPRWQRARWMGRFEVHDDVKVHTPGRFPPRWPSHAMSDQFALRWHARTLATAVPPSPVRWAIVFHPCFWPYIESLNCTHVLYYVYDNYSKMPDWSSEYSEMEAALIERADLLIASSSGMATSLSANGQTKARILPNGVDIDLFDQAAGCECPADLALIPRPRIIWVGSVNRKVDLKLVADCAVRRPDWHWVLIGRVHRQEITETEAGRQAFERCEALPNVHFLGERPRLAVPRYFQHADAHALCYRSDPGWWIDCSPMKLHEALATGRPVISTPLASVHPFADVVQFASSPDEWQAALEDALAGNGAGTPAQRAIVARNHSWEDRVDWIEQWLRDVENVQPRIVGPEASSPLNCTAGAVGAAG